MTSDEIWTEVYDKGYKNGIETLPFELKQLWYYIDFTIYVDNGGARGFIFNKSATEDECDDYFQPYIDSWKFFELTGLANLIENYNKRFLQAIKEYNSKGKNNFDQYEKKFKINEMVKELETLIVKVVWTDQNKKVSNWLDKNIDKIERLI